MTVLILSWIAQRGPAGVRPFAIETTTLFRRASLISVVIVAVFLGSSLLYKEIERKSSPDEPFCGLAFKIVNDQHGDLTYVRVYSGRLEKGSRVLNSNRNKRENISRMFQMHADDRNPIDVAEAGDIVACIGVKEALTGDTLCDEKSPVLLEAMAAGKPIVASAIPGYQEVVRHHQEALLVEP